MSATPAAEPITVETLTMVPGSRRSLLQSPKSKQSSPLMIDCVPARATIWFDTGDAKAKCKSRCEYRRKQRVENGTMDQSLWIAEPLRKKKKAKRGLRGVGKTCLSPLYTNKLRGRKSQAENAEAYMRELHRVSPRKDVLGLGLPCILPKSVP